MMKSFLKKIAYGYDGLIKEIKFVSDKKVTVIISAMMDGDENNWVNVAFHLEGLKEFSVRQEKNSVIIVLFDGISYLFKDNVHYIDFSPYGDPEEGTYDENEFRQSDIYFAADRVTYEVLPYKEDY